MMNSLQVPGLDQNDNDNASTSILARLTGKHQCSPTAVAELMESSKTSVSPQHSRAPSPSPSMRLGRILSSPYHHQGIRSRSSSPMTACVASTSNDSQPKETISYGEKFILIPASVDDTYNSNNCYSTNNTNSTSFNDETMSAAIDAAASQLRTTRFGSYTDTQQHDNTTSTATTSASSALQKVMSFTSTDAIVANTDDYSQDSSFDDDNKSNDKWHCNKLEAQLFSAISAIMRPQEPSISNSIVPSLKRANPIMSSTKEFCSPVDKPNNTHLPPISVLYFEHRLNDHDELENNVIVHY